MPGSLKTEAIVLRSIRYGEADRILHLFTPERGRLSAIAKGVRRSKSRFGGRLEPFFRLRLVLYQGRSDLFTVTSAETLAGHPRLREDGAALDGAARACDAVARLFDDHDAHGGVYHLLAQPARAARRRRRPRHARQRARLPAQAAARRRLRAAARGLRVVRRGRPPDRVQRGGRRRRLLRLRGDRVPALPGRARLPRRARSAARSRRSATRRRGRSPRPSGRSSRRSSTTRTSGSVRSERDKTPRIGDSAGAGVIMEGVSAHAVEPAFEARIRAWEEAALAPAAQRSYPADRRPARGRLRPAHPVPARPRPDRAREVVPPAQAQDAGLRRAGRRPLPHAADPHAGDDADQPHGGARAAAQRGPHRGDRARARPRPPAVRAHRRGRCSTAPAATAGGAGSATTSTRCASSTCSRTST